MTDATADAAAEPKKSKKAILLPALLTIVLGGAGFATSYLGFWSPMALMSGGKKTAPETTAPQTTFVTVPTLELPLPGAGQHTVTLGTIIETDSAHSADIQHQMPRIQDAFNTFLSEIDPAAFDKRGVLEIIRAELLTRTRNVLDEASVKDLLITEFRLK